jgi:branched-chain amino acid transport system substrate-binding protein
VDPLGYYLPPFAYANLQVLGEAVDATKSLDQDKLADYLRQSTFKTIVGDIKFGANGEWAEPRVLQIQFHDIAVNGLDQFKDDSKQTILWASAYKIGEVAYPYTDAKK